MCGGPQGGLECLRGPVSYRIWYMVLPGPNRWPLGSTPVYHPPGTHPATAPRIHPPGTTDVPSTGTAHGRPTVTLQSTKEILGSITHSLDPSISDLKILHVLLNSGRAIPPRTALLHAPHCPCSRPVAPVFSQDWFIYRFIYKMGADYSRTGASGEEQ